MKVRYTFPLDQPLKVEDHWPVPVLGGQLRLVEESGLVTAVEFTKGGVSKDLAFQIVKSPESKINTTIEGHDNLIPLVRERIKQAFSFVQCFFETTIKVEEVKIEHEAESDEEKDSIHVFEFSFGKGDLAPLPIPYDIITRALMAAEDNEAPEYISALANMARESFSASRYIDAFRFSFLLMEGVYGKGKFKSQHLKDAFLSSSKLTEAIQSAINEWNPRLVRTKSDTATLMTSSPSVSQIIDHLVSMRGHYFHGNVSKAGAWHPAKHDEAQAIAILGIDIIHLISSAAAESMFAEEYAKRHFEQAGQVGAHIKMEVQYRFSMPDNEKSEVKNIIMNIPGTKPTNTMAVEAAKQALQNFQNEFIPGRLQSVVGRNAQDKAVMFQIVISAG